MTSAAAAAIRNVAASAVNFRWHAVTMTLGAAVIMNVMTRMTTTSTLVIRHGTGGCASSAAAPWSASTAVRIQLHEPAIGAAEPVSAGGSFSGRSAVWSVAVSRWVRTSASGSRYVPSAVAWSGYTSGECTRLRSCVSATCQAGSCVRWRRGSPTCSARPVDLR